MYGVYGHGTYDYQQSEIEKSKCTKYGHGTLKYSANEL